MSLFKPIKQTMRVTSNNHQTTSTQSNAFFDHIGKINLRIFESKQLFVTNKSTDTKIFNEKNLKRLMPRGYGTNSINEFIIGLMNCLNMYLTMGIVRHKYVQC